jgi:NTE family protein
MSECLAFVLGGGGARGAMQVGALRALIEAGYVPDLLVGTSIGAVNATGLALWGADLQGIERLEYTFEEASNENIMDPRIALLLVRALSGHRHRRTSRRVREYFISKGIRPDLRFCEMRGVRLALVSANLDSGQPVIYGFDPGQSVLEGLLASIAVPPWFEPIEKDGGLIVDGGVLSNLPIEPALRMGATEIIALDLNDFGSASGVAGKVNQRLEKFIFAIIERQRCLETEIAEQQGVPVHHIRLTSSPPVPVWDFSSFRELVQVGYEIASVQTPRQ